MSGVAGEDWSFEEIEAIVVDHFARLADDIAERPYIKAERNPALLSRIARNKGSIELKHQNMSAILLGFGQPWIAGYRPAENFQASLTQVGRSWRGCNGSDRRRSGDWRRLRYQEQQTPLHR